MAAVTASIEIARCPEEVFAYLNELSRQAEWQKQIVSVRVDSDGPAASGTKVTEVRRVAGRARSIAYEITEHDPPRTFAFRGRTGPLRPVGKSTIEPLGDGSRSRVTLELDFVSRGLVAGLLRQRAISEARKQIPKDQQLLKALLEDNSNAVKVTRVVLTGAQGDIATAIARRLREAGSDVEALQRGDDVTEHVRSADAVIILDATTPGGTDYRLALEAVAQGLDQANVKRLVSVALVPLTQEAEKAFRARAEAAEGELVRTGHPLIALRVGLVVGVPGQPGPADGALFGDGKPASMPGNGDQRVRPLLLDDLVAVVIAAIHADSGPATVEAEGPDDVSVRELLQTLNPGQDPRVVRVDWKRVAIQLIFAVAPLLVFGRDTLPKLGYSNRLQLPAIVVVVFLFGVLIVYFQRELETSFLPTRDLQLCPDPPSALLGVRLKRVGAIWDEQALTERRQRRARLRSARRYALTQGSFWIAPFVLLCGVAAFVVGAQATIVSTAGLATRLAGITLAIVGGVMVFGGVALFTRRRSRYALGFLGSGLCVVTLLVILASAALGGDPPWWTLFGGAYLAAFAIGCCAALWKRGGLVVTNVMATRGQKVIGSVILGGTIVSVSQALYSSAYVSANVTPSLSADAQFTGSIKPIFDAKGASDHRFALPVTLKLHNPSSHSVAVLGAFYVVKAHELAPATPKQGVATAQERERRYVTYARSVVVDRGEAVSPGTVLEGGEEIVRRFVAIAPVGYTTASVRLDIALARPRDKREQDLGTSYIGKGINHSLARIVDPTWLHFLTRSTRYVHVVDAPGPELGCKSRIEIAAYVDDRRTTDPKRWCRGRTRIDEHYGVLVGQSYAETRLPETS